MTVPSLGQDYNWFESAPDGTLIPVPSEAPAGNPIRDDAQVTVSERRASGYYIAIYNGPPESEGHTGEVITEVLTEASLTKLEHLLGEAVGAAAESAIRFAGLVVGVAVSLLDPSPILKESLFQASLEDGTPVTYVVLDPQS